MYGYFLQQENFGLSPRDICGFEDSVRDVSTVRSCPLEQRSFFSVALGTGDLKEGGQRADTAHDVLTGRPGPGLADGRAWPSPEGRRQYTGHECPSLRVAKRPLWSTAMGRQEGHKKGTHVQPGQTFYSLYTLTSSV